jgi:hypothetical protein
VSEAITAWRGILIAVGALLLGMGGLTFLAEVTVDQYPGVVIWLGGAILLHDGVGAMAVFAVTVIARRTLRVIPFVVVCIVQAALAISVVVTVLVVPEIVKGWIGSANPTILPLDYARNLALFYAAVAAVTAIAIVIALARGRRRRPAPQTG